MATSRLVAKEHDTQNGQQSPSKASKPCKISYGCGFYFCQTCGGSDYPNDKPFACETWGVGA
ncbi:hypothetical protein FJU08_17450 [Martelella alba]|uniref:Uncharacterized protein n=1 Tax=Martelella alba TaxID=2590451 RepID=A0A506U7J8_9HYPH|nr:hypothetical protein [Martelella alba]TPW28589.1 hypothetical protein FJU08_17450 [Martelella alba]